MVKAGTYVNNQNKSTQTVYDNADNNNHTQKRKKKKPQHSWKRRVCLHFERLTTTDVILRRAEGNKYKVNSLENIFHVINYQEYEIPD